MKEEEYEYKYKNFISPGYFCEVAKDLEKLGLRNVSSPFDWCISDFEGILKLIENKFEDFMAYDNMAQSSNIRENYMDTKYGIYFFHDFSKYKTFEEQYYKVKEKYQRRIKRFI